MQSYFKLSNAVVLRFKFDEAKIKTNELVNS